MFQPVTGYHSNKMAIGLLTCQVKHIHNVDKTGEAKMDKLVNSFTNTITINPTSLDIICCHFPFPYETIKRVYHSPKTSFALKPKYPKYTAVTSVTIYGFQKTGPKYTHSISRLKHDR